MPIHEGTLTAHRPQIRPGIQLRREGSRWTLEDREGLRKVFVDPAHSGLVVMLREGRHSLQELLVPSDFTQKSPPHRLRELLGLLKRLDDADFLQEKLPPEQLRETQSLSSPFLSKRNFFDKRLFSFFRIEQIKTPFRSQKAAIVFYLLTIGLGVWSLGDLCKMPSTHFFFRPELGYDWVFLKIVASLSLLFSLSALWSTMSSLLAVGRVEAFEFSVFATAIGISVNESPIVNRDLRRLRVVAKIFAYILSWELLKRFFHLSGQSSHDLGLIAIFATFSLTHPYRQSLLSDEIERTASPDQLRSLWPYLRSRSLLSFIFGGKVFGEKFLLLYSSIAVAWSMLYVDLLSDYISQDWSVLYISLTTGPVTGRFAPALVVLVYALLLVSGVGPLVGMVLNNLIFPFWGSLQLLVRKVALLGGGNRSVTGESYASVLINLPLFEGFSENLLTPLLAKARLFEIPARIPLLVQGSPAAELYVLLEGEVEVSRRESSGLRQTLARLEAPLVFGESALTSENVRQADVLTHTRCKILRVDGVQAKTLWFENLDKESKRKFFHRILLQQFLATSAAFHGFPVELSSVLEELGRVRDIHADEVLVTEGAVEDTFFLLLRGQVEILKNSQRVDLVSQGGFFGEIAVLLQSPRTASVRVVQDGTVFELKRSEFWNLVARFPMLGVEIENVAEQRLKSQDQTQ